jgi:alanine dehydrogenase
VHDVDVLTHRPVEAVGAPIHSARMVNYSHDKADPRRSQVNHEGESEPLADFLARHDLIVNCVLQDTRAPATFLVEADLPTLRPETLIVDVSCDEGMGFSWARPTSFEDPMFTVGDNVRYYAVDHSPSYLWNSATWEISSALLPYLPTVLGGPEAWEGEETIRRAIEIRDGVIVNPDILAFQNRSVA